MSNTGKPVPPWTHAELAGMNCCQTGVSLVQAYVKRFLGSWNTEKYSKALDEALILGRPFQYPNGQVSNFARNWLASLPVPAPAILSTKSFDIIIAPTASNCFELQVRAEFSWRASHGLYWSRTIHRHIIPLDCDSAPLCIKNTNPVSEDASIESGWTLREEGGVKLCGDWRHAAVYDPVWAPLSMERASQKSLSQSMYGGPDRTTTQSRQDSGFCEVMDASHLMGTLAPTASTHTVSDSSSLPIQTDMSIENCHAIQPLVSAGNADPAYSGPVMPEVQIANTNEIRHRSASGSDSLLTLAIHPDRPFDHEAADLYTSPSEMYRPSAMNWGPSSNSQVNQSLDVDSSELTRRSTGMKTNGRSMPPSHADSGYGEELMALYDSLVGSRLEYGIWMSSHQ